MTEQWQQAPGNLPNANIVNLVNPLAPNLVPVTLISGAEYVKSLHCNKSDDIKLFHVAIHSVDAKFSLMTDLSCNFWIKSITTIFYKAAKFIIDKPTIFHCDYITHL